MTTATAHAHPAPEPVGGPLFTRTFNLLLALGAMAGLLLIWRFAAGLGAVTGLSDGYPWGLWIAFDVVTGTALACGGYGMALLVYIFNRGRYHPLIRPAILTSALGYSLAGLAVAIDVGRPWLIYKVPIFFKNWNLNSALLEVALCIMAYIVVLWIELAPAFLEKWEKEGRGSLARTAGKTRAFLEKALVWIVALGMLLPTMHQSSLGSVMMLVGPRLDPLWYTTFLPLFFLISCLAMGYAMVACESTFSSVAFGKADETPMLRRLFGLAAWIMAAVMLLRIVDVGLRGHGGAIFAFDRASVFFLLETVIFTWPLVLHLRTRERGANRGELLRGALLLILGGALYRFDTYLVAFEPGAGWSYFPTVPEILITVGLVALEIAAYIAIVKKFPILAGRAPARGAHA